MTMAMFFKHDAYIRYTWIYPFKLKSHTLTTFVQFKSLVELQLNIKIKYVQTNGGNEFRPFIHFLTSHGITHRFTSPYTYYKNGSVETKQV